MDSVLHLVGIAKKAGRLEIGEEPVGAACRARQVKVLLLAGDAAENTCRRAGHFAESGDTVLVQTPYSKSELGGCVGRTSCAMLAITDAGLAAALVRKLAENDAARYGQALELLERRAAKVLQRQKEQRAHEKNLRQGKQRPWAPPSAQKESKHQKPKSRAGQNAVAAQSRIQIKQVPADGDAQAPVAATIKRPVLKGKVSVKGKLPTGLKKTP